MRELKIISASEMYNNTMKSQGLIDKEIETIVFFVKNASREGEFYYRAEAIPKGLKEKVRDFFVENGYSCGLIERSYDLKYDLLIKWHK